MPCIIMYVCTYACFMWTPLGRQAMRDDWFTQKRYKSAFGTCWNFVLAYKFYEFEPPWNFKGFNTFNTTYINIYYPWDRSHDSEMA